MEIKSLTDKSGNKIIAHTTDESIRLELRLASENRNRSIGTVDLKSRILYIERNRHKHLMRINESYGFNYNVIGKASTFDHVFLTEVNGVTTNQYLFPVSLIMENLNFLNFKHKGFELQTFLLLSLIERFKVTTPSIF